MGKLDKVMRMEAERKAAPARKAKEKSQQEASKRLFSTIDDVNGKVQMLQEAIAQLGEYLPAQINGIQIPDYSNEFGVLATGISEAQRSMLAEVEKLTTAISSIKWPEIEIPEQKEVDLSPVLAALAAKEEVKDEKPTQWEFDIERDQYGIRKVYAKPL